VIEQMKLSTRIKISYLLVFVVPILLILAMVGTIARLSMNSLQKKFDLDQSSYDMILNPMSMMGHIAASTIDELQTAAKNDPDKLTDTEYLKNVNDRLGDYYSCLLVMKGNKQIYSGLPEGSSYNTDIEYNTQADTESIYVVNELPYHIQQFDFKYSDGTVGKVLIYTDVEQILPQTKDLVVRIIVGAVFILFIVSILTMLWLYRGIIRPIRKLKDAAENISEGNLNVSVTAESDDEIGELCNAFEAMRIKLKNQIEQNIQYEKDSKELISNISHDLKTPMTSIKGYIEGLKDGVADTPEKRDKYIRTIYNKVNDMDNLIEELFLYAKLDSHSVSYSFVKLNISDYFQDCADEISLDLESQGVEFGYFNYLDKSTVVIADPEQLKRVINNIVGNAIKYAYPGRPLRISIRVMEEAEFVKVEIEDNGRGIARKEVPLIFDRLYRTDASRNSTKGGSGLGLSIAKKIIEEHGGKIWAQSTEGVGTTMCFALRKYKEQKGAVEV